ncbi:MAG: N-methylhydantoinase B [Gammaproteobacteria bacterium]
MVLRAHWADIGGMTPGSLSGAAREILQEGLRLNHVPVPKDGRSPVMDLIFDNVRVTHEAMADFHAAIGTCRVAERRLNEVINRFGLESVENAANEMLDAAQRRMQAALAQVPSGTYRFTSYMDGHDRANFPLRVDIALEFNDGSVRADFTGTAAQIPAPLNAGPAIAPTSVLTVLKSFLDPAGVINSGTLRPIDIHVPVATILHATHPAPCGGLNEVRFASDAAVMGALGQAVPARMTGDVRGSTNHTYIGGQDEARGRDFIFYEYPSGGTGAFAGSDGNTAVRAFNEGENVSIQSSEMVERIYPLRVVRSEMRPDSGGPGQFRGGSGLVREVEVLVDDARFSLLSDRNLVPPYGVNGGRSGRPNRFSVWRAGELVPSAGFPGKVSGFELRRGDRVRMESSGGGGYGYAENRSHDALLDDLADGIITATGLAPYRVACAQDDTLESVPCVDEILDPKVTFGYADAPPANCLVGQAYARALAIELGQMLELVPQAGAPLRFWVHGFDEHDTALVLAQRWEHRLPPGPYRLRATEYGTADFRQR